MSKGKKVLIIFQFVASLFLLLTVFIKDYNNNFIFRDYYLKYYYLSFFLFFASFLLIFLKKNSIKIYFINLCAIIFGLYLLEFYMFIKTKDVGVYNPNYLRQIKQNPKLVEEYNYDTTNALNKYLELSKKMEIYLMPSKVLISNNNKNIFIINSISNSKHMMCNENGYWPIVKTDKYGYINSNDQWSDNYPSLLIIGDSNMLTACHFYKNGVAGKFKKKFEDLNLKINTLTLSHGNNGPLMKLANIIEYIKETSSPKVLLWVYYDGNDAADLQRELKNEILINYLFEENFSQNLAPKQDFIDKELKSKFNEDGYVNKILNINNYKLIDFVRLIKLRVALNKFQITGSIKNEFSPKNLDIFEKIIIKAKKIANKQGSNFYFVYMPDNFWYSSIDEIDEIDDSRYEKIVNILKKNKINFIDFNKEIKIHPDPKSLLPFRTYGHFNEKGVEFFVNRTYENLLEFNEKLLLPSTSN